MHRLKCFSYPAAIAFALIWLVLMPSTFTFIALLILISAAGINPQYSFGACNPLTAFRVATESLDQETIRSPHLGKAYYWRNATKMGEYPLNVGVTRSTFTIMSTEPTDDPTKWFNVTLTGSPAQPSPGCDTNYEDVLVNFYERTYGPKRRRFEGPVLCRDQFKYQHLIDDFINDYIDEMGKSNARVWEFGLRSDYMGFGDWWVDGAKTVGPNAIATAPRAFQGLTLGNLEIMAQDAINSGAGIATEDGYVMDGPAGPVFPLYIDMMDAAQIFRANPNLRDDAHFASMSDQTSDSNYSIWKKIGANRVIQNFRYVPTDIAPRLNFVGGAYVVQTPFKSVNPSLPLQQMGPDDDQLLDAYKNAAFRVAIAHHPLTFTCEVVRPESAGLNWEPVDYNGDWRFYTGGERICNPGVFDPEHELGRHFAHIEYAPKPRKIHYTKVIVYKNCPQTVDQIFCS